jgi:hypothetical protein
MNDISTYVPSTQPEWVERLAKVGLIAKGIVYCLIGVLAFMAALELGNTSTSSADQSGVFKFIGQQSFGRIMLGIIAIGLLSYSLWRLIQAVKDTKNEGTDAKGIGQRLLYAFRGLVYLALAFTAAKIALGGGSSSNSNSNESMVSQLLQQPYGQWLVGFVAVAIAIAAFHQFYLAFSDAYKKKVQAAGLKHETETFMIKFGKFGYIARGVVWLILSYFFLQAALQSDAQEAGGTSSAFRFLEQSSYGSVLLVAVALGMICYGLFMFMQAKYPGTDR